MLEINFFVLSDGATNGCCFPLMLFYATEAIVLIKVAQESQVEAHIALLDTS